MKRFMSGNNRANESKKAKVECNYERDKKECIPNFFDYETIQDDVKEEKAKQENPERSDLTNIFHFHESSQKKRKINSISNDEDSNGTSYNSTLCNDHGYINKRNKKKMFTEEREIEPILSINQKKSKSNEEKEKNCALPQKENDGTKITLTENCYYRHINNLLKEIHFSRLERLRNQKAMKYLENV